jgi:hypothetical protein
MTRRTSRILDLSEGFILASTAQSFDILSNYGSAPLLEIPDGHQFLLAPC